jgi:DNA-directed RNA polymerase specialized sigma24 family protein
MKVPRGYTEGQVLEIINRVVSKMAAAFTFGHYDIEDIKQEGTIFALQALEGEKYDGERPLENFLYCHVRNRYINLKRKKYSRHEPPCCVCPFYDEMRKKSQNQCAAFEEKMDCSKWALFIKLNTAKRNISEPIDLDEVDDEHEDNMREADFAGSLEGKELMERIDRNLDIGLRSDYLKLLAGVKLPKRKREELRAAISEILREDG